MIPLTSGNELFDQVTLSGAIIAFTNWLKSYPRFAWITADTERLNRAFAWTLGALAGLHVTWTWDASAGDLSIHGLTLANVATALWTSAFGAGRSILFQQGLFRFYGAAMATQAASGIAAATKDA